MVSILARFTDDTKMAFRISTGCMQPFHDLDLLDEDKFKAHVEKEQYYIDEEVTDQHHQDYYNARCFFAPTDYGLLFFDFKEKQLWSSNNYNSFFLLSTWLVKSQYSYLADILSLGNETKETLTVSEGAFVNGQIVTTKEYHFLAEYSEHFSSLFYIQQVLDRKGTFKYKNNMLPNTLNDLYSILAYITGEDLLSDAALKKGPQRLQFKTFTMDMHDMEAILPDWCFHNFDGRQKSVQSVFDYVQQENLLSERDAHYWNVYLKKQKGH